MDIGLFPVVGIVVAPSPVSGAGGKKLQPVAGEMRGHQHDVGSNRMLPKLITGRKRSRLSYYRISLLVGQSPARQTRGGKNNILGYVRQQMRLSCRVG